MAAWRRHRAGRPPVIGPAQGTASLAQVRARPDATRAEHGTQWAAEQGGPRQRRDAVARVDAAGLAAPKQLLQASERDRTTRAAWWAERARLTPARLVFGDERGSYTAMTRLRARAPRGQRARGRVPRNHGSNVTLVAELTPGGMGPALVVEGGADRRACET